MFLLTQDPTYLDGLSKTLGEVKAGFNFVQADGSTKKITLFPSPMAICTPRLRDLDVCTPHAAISR